MVKLRTAVLLVFCMALPPVTGGQSNDQAVVTASVKRRAEQYELSIQAYLPGFSDKDIAEIELRRWHIPTRVQGVAPVWSYRVRVQKSRFKVNENFEVRVFEAGRYLVTVRTAASAMGLEGAENRKQDRPRAVETHREVWVGASGDRMDPLEKHGKMLWQDILDAEQMIEDSKTKEKYLQNWSRVRQQMSAKRHEMGSRTHKSGFAKTYEHWDVFFGTLTQRPLVNGNPDYKSDGAPLTEIPVQRLQSLLGEIRESIARDYLYGLVLEAQGLEERLESVLTSDGVRYTEAYRKEFHQDFTALRHALDTGLESGLGPVLKKLPETGEKMKDVSSMMKLLEASVAEGVTKEDAAQHIGASRKISRTISARLMSRLVPEEAPPPSPQNE